VDQLLPVVPERNVFAEPRDLLPPLVDEPQDRDVVHLVDPDRRRIGHGAYRASLTRIAVLGLDALADVPEARDDAADVGIVQMIW